MDILFLHPYTKIDFLIDKLGIHRQTASKYLNKLEELGILEGVKLGRSKYFINKALFELLKKSCDRQNNRIEAQIGGQA